ncbi:MAG: Ig-like domain-containing protein, partial [Eubacterium sp.]|nr:Ig-like domain-containing protein [Eubacterium sp.]
VSLSSYEGKKVSARVKPSRHAGNKKAKVYDKTIRWTSTNPSVAKVDQKGNITAQGKSGTCKVYARAHNGDSDWLWVKVKAYARPKKFDGMDVMQEDMVKLIQLHGEDLKDIADFFEKNRIKDNSESHTILQFKLDPGRDYVMAEKNLYKIDYKKLEKKLYQVLDSFPGIMEIYITNYGVHFVLEGNGGGEYVELTYLFYDDSKKDNVPGLAEESDDNFKTAPRWKYHYSRPVG